MEIEEFSLVYMVDEEDLGDNRRGLPLMRLAPGFHRRVKANTSLQNDDVPIDETTTRPLFMPYYLFRVDGEVRDEEICESFRSNHSVKSLEGKRDIRVVHRSYNAAHSTSTVFIEVDNKVAEILGQHGRIPVAGLMHRNFFRGLYRACHNRLKTAIRRAKIKSWFNLCEEVSSASWSAIHRFIARGRSSPIGPPLLKHDNGSPYNPHETCQAVLNYFFLPDTRPHPQRNAISAHSDELEFKPREVLRAIHRCGKRKVSGPDSFDSKCLDLGGPSLQFLLAELFTKCLRMGHFPRPWKEGRLILLPKPSNQPPVSWRNTDLLLY
ncbi:hypothetical protein LAZ67_23001117 [Cordylochernes scorpioides]|uniref:RNA-directed DNA polymerase from mobile element jockey n=1 Tax=Cordylochernes scorpioides TaxID=51811 RepID=A0ABY6LSY1_9ARAC|nr:hypothetical protein LAZ67_23001117 [Cordylochernes scorpioides]